MALVARAMEIEMTPSMWRMLQILEQHVLGSPAPADPANPKPCRNAIACGMCAKPCNERIK